MVIVFAHIEHILSTGISTTAWDQAALLFEVLPSEASRSLKARCLNAPIR
jgi:hypothetical protein